MEIKMANDRADFADEVRNKAWFSSDTRMALDGKAVTVILQKQGKAEREDLSQVEVIQAGHMMEPFIARIAEDKLGYPLAKADWTGTHPTEPWMQSHFDYVKEVRGGYIPYEIKNYNLNRMNKFSDDPLILPDADRGQLIQEAICLNASEAHLCVLFGGQYFRHYEMVVTDEMKLDLTKQMAVYWGHVVAGTTPDPQTVQECKLVYPQSNPDVTVMADREIENMAAMLRRTKEQIKQLEDAEEELTAALQKRMQRAEQLVTIDGTILATWKASKGSKRFDPKVFQQAMPEMYEKFCFEQPGSRRFLIK
jgi:predicted phage-related endonuclease